MARQIAIAAGNNTTASKTSSLARLLNGFAEVLEVPASPFPVSVIATPGSRKLFTLDEGVEITGMHQSDKTIFFTTRTAIYRIRNNRAVKVANATLHGMVSMADNGIDLVITDTTTQLVVVSLTNFAARTIEAPAPFSSIIFADGFFLAAKTGTADFYVSGAYSTTFTALGFARAEAKPDVLMALIAYQRQAYMGGSMSFEVWYASNSTVPFDPNPSAYMDTGMYAPRAYTTTDKGIYWLGDDLSVYFANGYTPQRISNHGIEQALATTDCRQAWMCNYAYAGHRHIFLQVPGLDYTMVFDEATGLWHDRQVAKKKHFAKFMETKDGTTYVADSRAPAIWVLDQASGYDGGVMIDREMITPPDGYTGRVSFLELVTQFFELPSPAMLGPDMTQAQAIMAAYTTPAVRMSYTDDDGITWSIEEAIPLKQVPQMTVRWNSCGYCLSGRRSYRFRMKSGIPFVWSGVFVG